MQDYPKKSGRGYFFAGLLFALIPGMCGHWMLHKEQILVENAAPRKPYIAILNARAKPHFDRAKQNITAVVKELTSYSSMVKFCYLAAILSALSIIAAAAAFLDRQLVSTNHVFLLFLPQKNIVHT